MTYDVAIIGAGTAGVYAAYELLKLRPNLHIVVLEMGQDIYHRSCPIVAGKVKECISCKPCSIMSGFGGAGAFSDGKYNFTTEFGGWLGDYLDPKELLGLIDYVDSVNVRFGATEDVFSTDTPEARAIEKKALENDLHLLQAKCKHLGTERNLKILTNIYEFLAGEGCEFRFKTHVEKIAPVDGGYRLTLGGGETLDCCYCISAPGRCGAEWFADRCRELGLEMTNNQVDLGVRVELPAKVFEHITDVVYESKLLYRTKQYGDVVRTFCMNPYGHVVAENVDGLITVNGHSYADPALRSENTNFALLVSNRFTSPFNQPYSYGKHIASLNATPGDLSLVLPKRHMDNIIEMIYALDKIAPGTANYDTLLYGVEVKFYSARISLTPQLETQLPNLFAIGDGAGITRGLAQAGASGVQAARAIAERL